MTTSYTQAASRALCIGPHGRTQGTSGRPKSQEASGGHGDGAERKGHGGQERQSGAPGPQEAGPSPQGVFETSFSGPNLSELKSLEARAGRRGPRLLPRPELLSGLCIQATSRA